MKKYQIWVSKQYWDAPWGLQYETTNKRFALRNKALWESMFRYHAYKIVEVEV